MIPPETIEQVRQANDIAEVLGQYIRLKKRGRSFDALCPFHTEKTPSFKVSPEKQIYHCFGCGKGGNVFTFLMEHESMTFVEAVKLLASRANITIREDRPDINKDSFERLHYAHTVALEYFREQLNTGRQRASLNTYLKEKRSLTNESIDFFQLGYAPESWDGFIKFAAQKDLKPSELARAGLVSYSSEKDKHFDRFRQRLMFPIFNLSQKPIAFGGRTLKKGDNVKYINSPETPLYTKGNVLYGLNCSREQIRKEKTVLVVEGYFDVISLWQAGIQSVVASSGTAFTPQQARLLARFAETVLLFFDADSAGQVAALRSVGTLFDAGLDVRVVVAPTGEDPDSIARKFGHDRIDELCHDALHFIDFRLRQWKADKTDTIGKDKLIKEFIDIGGKIQDPTRRVQFFQKSADSLSVGVGQFITPPRVNARKNEYPPATAKLESELLSFLFCGPGSLDEVLRTISPKDFVSSLMSRLYSAMTEQYHSRGEISAHHLLSLYAEDEEMLSCVSTIVSIEWDPEIVEEETRKQLKAFISLNQKKIRGRLMDELRQAEEDKDQAKATEIVQDMKLHGL